MIRIVPTGDLGLDLLLGGGWRLVTRLPKRESATVLVRGGSGAGKTLIGFQVALELARALGGDVAIGCVEILPSEYIAQLSSARPSLTPDRVAALPATPTSAASPRVFVGLLPDLDPEQPDLVAGLETLTAEVKAAGGNPVVFVVDSLIEGYGIGWSASRLSVDAVMKFAAQGGVGVVLCEEVVTDTPSPWVFAADTVLQVGVESRERGRWLEVRKHRFGRCASGRHEIDLVGREHPEVFPAPHAWMAGGIEPILAAHGWRFGTSHDAPRLQNPITVDKPLYGTLVFVTSSDALLARAFASATIGDRWKDHRTLMVQFDPLIVEMDGWRKANLDVAHLPAAYGAARGLRSLIERLGNAHRSDAALPLGAMLLGDLNLVLAAADATAWVEAIRALASVIARTGWNVPIITYDGSKDEGGEARSRMAKHADLTVEFGERGHQLVAAVNQRWPLEKLDLVPSRIPLVSTFVPFGDAPRTRGRADQ